jgi:WD40 repeat protein
MSPDGEAIVTGAGDETLRFWNVFSKARSQKVCCSTYSLEVKHYLVIFTFFYSYIIEIYKNIYCYFQCMF